MVNFYIYYNTHTHIYNNGTPILTGTEIYCSTSQTDTAFSTKLTPLLDMPLLDLIIVRYEEIARKKRLFVKKL